MDLGYYCSAAETMVLLKTSEYTEDPDDSVNVWLYDCDAGARYYGGTKT